MNRLNPMLVNTRMRNLQPIIPTVTPAPLLTMEEAGPDCMIRSDR